MRQHADETSLVEEQRARIGVLSALGVEQLDRDLAACPDLTGEVDVRHAALGQQANQLVVTKTRLERQRWVGNCHRASYESMVGCDSPVFGGDLVSGT